MAATNSFVKQSNVKRFRPPLKTSQESSSSPLDAANRLTRHQETVSSPLLASNQSATDSLPESQTHTVLSYCDNYQEHSGDSLSPSSGPESSEEEHEQPHTRFTAHKTDSHPSRRLYAYYPLPSRKRATADESMRGIAESSKRVRIASPARSRGRDCDGRGLVKGGSAYDLSVYEYSPTPVQEGEGSREERRGIRKRRTSKSCASICGYAGSIQEQVRLTRISRIHHHIHTHSHTGMHIHTHTHTT